MPHKRKPPVREELPDTRPSITHKVKIESNPGPTSVYIIVGLRKDGTPCEVFIQVGKQGSTLRGLMDTCAIQMSWLLQYGVPLSTIVEQFSSVQFEPMGPTSNPDVPDCTSIIDYVVHWLEAQFITKKETV